LLGADNDPLERDLTTPALSSVAIPCCEIGRQVGLAIQRGLEQPLGPVRVCTDASTGLLIGLIRRAWRALSENSWYGRILALQFRSWPSPRKV
jgi:hypothetical protein